MGGIGSGRHFHFGAKDTTSDYHRLSVGRWSRAGILSHGRSFGWQWESDGATVASIQVAVEDQAVRLNYRTRVHGGAWRDMDYHVSLDRTPCHFGGERVWFLCPAQVCSRRVAYLYGGAVFVCRHCHNLAYPVQREHAADRAARRASKLYARLGWDGGIFDPVIAKPKGMHWQTYHRIVAKADKASAESVGLMMEHVSSDPASLALLHALT